MHYSSNSAYTRRRRRHVAPISNRELAHSATAETGLNVSSESTIPAPTASPKESSQKRSLNHQIDSQDRDSDYVIVARGLEVAFHSKSIFDQATLHLCRTDRVCIVGANGEGKTTLLKILGGIERKFKGQLKLFGKDLTRGVSDSELSVIRRRIGFLWQQAFVEAELTCFENVMSAAVVRGVSIRRRSLEVQNALKLVGLAGRAKDRASQLNGGDKRLLALARATVGLYNGILLADEPTANLSAESSLNMLRILQSVADRQALAVVVVTHNHSWARQFTQQVVRLSGGRLNSDVAEHPRYYTESQDDERDLHLEIAPQQNNTISLDSVSHCTARSRGWTALPDIAWLAKTRAVKRWVTGMGLFFVVAAFAATCGIAFGLRQISDGLRQNEVQAHGLNKIQITPSASMPNLNRQNVEAIREIEDVAFASASYTQILEFSVDGERFTPVVCTSFVPGLESAGASPIERPANRAEQPQLIVSSGLLRRLESQLAQRGSPIHVRRIGSQDTGILCRSVAVAGDLGLEGARVDVDVMRSALQNVSGEVPIEAIDLWAKSQNKIAALQQRLEQAGFRCQSSYNKMGRVSNLLGTIAGVVWPLVILLCVAVLLATFGLFAETLSRDRPLIAFWRAAGAERWLVFLVYFLQASTLAASSALVGVGVAHICLKRLGAAFEIPANLTPLMWLALVSVVALIGVSGAVAATYLAIRRSLSDELNKLGPVA